MTWTDKTILQDRFILRTMKKNWTIFIDIYGPRGDELEFADYLTCLGSSEYLFPKTFHKYVT